MDQKHANSQLDRIGKLPIQIAVRICQRSLTLDELVQWAPGTVLSFDTPAKSPLKLCIGERDIGDGQAVHVGSKIGLRISRVVKSDPAT